MGHLRYIGLNPPATAEAVNEKFITGVTELPPEALAVEAAAKSCTAPVPDPANPNPRTTALPEVIVVNPVAFRRSPFPTS
jgi:hypothetical protein